MIDNLRTALVCPFPLEVHPAWETAHEQSVEWACALQLVQRDTKQHQHMRKARFAWLSAATHPGISADELLLAAKFMIWYFAYDDPYVNPNGPDSLQRLLAVQARLMAILHGGRSQAADPPVVRALEEVYRGMQARGAHSPWFERFCHDLAGFLEANRWVLQQRLQRRTPDLASYLNLRQYDVGLYPCLDMAAFFRGLDPNAALFRSESFEVVKRMAATHCFMINDLFGVERELRDHDATNFVLVVQNEFGLTFAEAVEWSIRRCNRELESLLVFEQLLPAMGIELDAPAREYLEICHAWVPGQIGWYAVSGRYNDATLGLGDYRTVKMRNHATERAPTLQPAMAA